MAVRHNYELVLVVGRYFLQRPIAGLLLLTSMMGCGEQNAINGGAEVKASVPVYYSSYTLMDQGEEGGKSDIIELFDAVGIRISFTNITNPTPRSPSDVLEKPDCAYFYRPVDDVQGAETCGPDMLKRYAAAYRSAAGGLTNRVLLYVNPVWKPSGVNGYIPGGTIQSTDSTHEMSFLYSNEIYAQSLEAPGEQGYFIGRLFGFAGSHELGHQLGEEPHLTHVDYELESDDGDNLNHNFLDTPNGKCVMEKDLTTSDVYQGFLHFCYGHNATNCCAYQLRRVYGLPLN